MHDVLLDDFNYALHSKCCPLRKRAIDSKLGREHFSLFLQRFILHFIPCTEHVHYQVPNSPLSHTHFDHLV